MNPLNCIDLRKICVYVYVAHVLITALVFPCLCFACASMHSVASAGQTPIEDVVSGPEMATLARRDVG